MRAALIAHRHCSSEVVAKYQCAPRSQQISGSPDAIEEISGKASVESCFISEN